MEYIFFWISAAVSVLLLISVLRLKGIGIQAWIVGIASIAYSMVFDVFFGDRLGLYYYISPAESTLYILLSALLVYTPLNITYAAFLPENPGKIIKYTLVWMAAMLVFEYASVVTGTVVFTGWKPVPWSVVAYAVTYTILVAIFRYAMRLPQNKGYSH